MNDLTVSAPGKILLGGEYAVLVGAEAVVTAVNRRAVARYCSSCPKDTSAIVQSVMQTTDTYLRRRGATMNPNTWVTVQSAGFRLGKLKLGLGSSAAVAAAAVGAVFEAGGLPIATCREEILAVAQAAHRSAQKGKGSGADVASAVMGGTILYAMSGPPEPVSLTGLHLAVVFSGRSVSTEEMIGHITAFQKRDAEGYAKRMAELTASAADLASAYRNGLPREVIRASSAYAESMDRLGRAARVSIVTKEHRCAMTLAEKLGGAAKPSGAGGGAIAVALFDTEEALSEFRIQCIRHELIPLDIEGGAVGLKADR